MASEPPGLLEEREGRAVEVDADVGGGQRAGDERGEERPHADGEAEPERPGDSRGRCARGGAA